MSDDREFDPPAERADLSLVGCWSDAVAAVLAGLTDARGVSQDPFRMPLLVVPSRAHSRAIAQQLARREGVAVGLSGVPEARLRSILESRLLGLDTGSDPWRTEPLAARIQEILQTSEEPWTQPVRQHLEAMTAKGTINPGWQAAWRTATVFARLALELPQLLADWAAGGAQGADGEPVDPARSWWPPLWRALLDEGLEIDDPLARHRRLMAALADSSLDLGWSRCVWLAGPCTGAPIRELALALGARLPTRVVHLDHGHPRPDAVPPAWAAFNQVRSASLRSWQQQFAARVQSAPPRPAQVPESLRGRPPVTLLSALPGPVGTPAEGPGRSKLVADGTVAVHACHGADRQVEVVRDVLCQAYAELPGLEPRDVVIVCPDRRLHQVLLGALLSPADPGLAGGHPARSLRIQAPASAAGNPVAQAVVQVLGLGSSRAGGSQLVQLASMPSVARRFSFTADDLADIARLVTDAGIRWGIDAAARSRAGLAGARQSTWLAGVERMLLAAAMSSVPPGWLATVTPIDGVESADIDLVGRLAELVSRLRRAIADCQAPATAQQWTRRLARIVGELTQPAPGQAWQGPATVGALSQLVATRPQEVLEISQVSGILADRMAEIRSPIWFDGSTHICSPADLDAIDHEVVILVEPDSSDLDPDPLSGLRDHDETDADPGLLARQMLFDTMAMARRRLVVVRQAYDPVTNQPVLPGPFSTALDQRLSDLGVEPSSVRVWHGLQPFSASEFAAADGWRSFDPVCAAAARAAHRPDTGPALDPLDRHHGAPLLPAPETVGSGIWSPAELAAVLAHPARALLRSRLGTGTRSWHQEPADELPLELGPLEGYGVRARLLNDLELGASPADARTAERLRGSTPPGNIGLGALNSQLDRASAILAATRRARRTGPESLVAVSAELSDGDLPPLSWPPGRLMDPSRPLRLAGRVRVWGDTVVRSSPSRASARDLLSLWIELLAVAASRPGSWRGVLVCDSTPWQLVAPDSDRAQHLLSGLARAAWWSGQQLVPLAIRTFAALSGLLPAPRPDWRSGRSGVGVAWAREFDADWAVFLDDDQASLQAGCQALGCSAEDLAGWFLEPVAAAAGRLPVAPSAGEFR